MYVGTDGRPRFAGALRQTLGIVALVALARERGLDAVYVPALGACEATRLGSIGVMRGAEGGIPLRPC